jgi:hypothetical protein
VGLRKIQIGAPTENPELQENTWKGQAKKKTPVKGVGGGKITKRRTCITGGERCGFTSKFPINRAGYSTENRSKKEGPHRSLLGLPKTVVMVGIRGNSESASGERISQVDMCSVKQHVRFTPESGHVQCN